MKWEGEFYHYKNCFSSVISVLIVLLSVYGTAAEIMHNGNIEYHVLEDDIAPADREKNTGAFTFHTSYF